MWTNGKDKLQSYSLNNKEVTKIGYKISSELIKAEWSQMFYYSNSNCLPVPRYMIWAYTSAYIY